VIRVRVEVSDRAGNRSNLEVEAESIERALRQASARYSGWEARVVFPINPEGFFAGGAPAMIRAEVVRPPDERAHNLGGAPDGDSRGI
jgi:hypothetical protein